jgi:CheY-like chemotaxis protein
MTNRKHTPLVLVVEDDPSVLDALRMALEDEGAEVVTALHGEAALQMLHNGLRPGVILLDLQMPIMDGWSFLEARRSEPQLANIPVVVISANAGPSRTAPYVGVAAVLEKPLDPLDVVRVVERAI